MSTFNAEYVDLTIILLTISDVVAVKRHLPVLAGWQNGSSYICKKGALAGTLRLATSNTHPFKEG